MFKIEKFDLLLAVYILCIALAELMGGKVFSIAQVGNFRLGASVAIFVIPVIFSINDIIAEVYGKERARSIVRTGIFMVFLIFLFSALAIMLPPSKRSPVPEEAYDAVFGKSLRIAGASLISFAIAELLDVLVFIRVKKAFGKSKLWLRNNLSNFISQFVDTVIFMFLAFYAFNRPFDDNFGFLLGIIIPYWLLKCALSVLETPFVYAGVKWLKSDIKKK